MTGCYYKAKVDFDYHHVPVPSKDGLAVAVLNPYSICHSKLEQWEPLLMPRSKRLPSD